VKLAALNERAADSTKNFIGILSEIAIIRKLEKEETFTNVWQ